MTEIFIGEKEKRTNKGTDKQYVAVLCCTIQLITIKLGTDFRILSQVSAEKFLTEKNVHLYFIGVIEGKIEILKKEGKMRIGILIFIYTLHFAYMKVCTKFENIGSKRSREICDKKFHWRERKTNK